MAAPPHRCWRWWMGAGKALLGPGRSGQNPTSKPSLRKSPVPHLPSCTSYSSAKAKTTTTNKFLSTGSITGTWGDTKALLGDILAVAETFPTGMSCFFMVQCRTNCADPPECFISLCSCAFHHSRAEDWLQNSAGNAAASSFAVFSSKCIYFLLV